MLQSGDHYRILPTLRRLLYVKIQMAVPARRYREWALRPRSELFFANPPADVAAIPVAGRNEPALSFHAQQCPTRQLASPEFRSPQTSFLSRQVAFGEMWRTI